MKKSLLALFAISFPLNAFGISSYSAPQSTCQALQNAIQNEGSAVIYTKPEIYFLAVRGIEECPVGDDLSLALTKTRNHPKCPLHTCKRR